MKFKPLFSFEREKPVQITAVTVCFDDLMQLDCVQLVISLDYLLNAASRLLLALGEVKVAHS